MPAFASTLVQGLFCLLLTGLCQAAPETASAKPASPAVASTEAAPADAPLVGIDEKRLRTLESELRCLVCQNQTLADSSAGLAGDLRLQVVEQMRAGKSDDEIKDYLVARYGDFILYKPRFKAETYLLWVGPFLILALAIGVGFVVIRRRARLAPAAEAITDPMQAQVEALVQAAAERPPGSPSKS